MRGVGFRSLRDSACWGTATIAKAELCGYCRDEMLRMGVIEYSQSEDMAIYRLDGTDS